MASPTPAHVTNGSGSHVPTKRRIASSSIDGSNLTVKFSNDITTEPGAELSADTSTKTFDATRDMLAAVGLATVVQNAYSQPSAKDDPVAAARKALSAVLSGTWRPGPPRGEPQQPALFEALVGHMAAEGSPTFSAADIPQFLSRYAQKHDLKTTGAAQRKLRTHPDISKRIAEIEAARAKSAKDKVKSAPRESLLDV
jgi:hypothetical protein